MCCMSYLCRGLITCFTHCSMKSNTCSSESQDSGGEGGRGGEVDIKGHHNYQSINQSFNQTSKGHVKTLIPFSQFVRSIKASIHPRRPYSGPVGSVAADREAPSVLNF